jgi:hypothetical protein
MEQYVNERAPETRQLVVSTLNVIPEFSNLPKMPYESIIVYAGDNAIRSLTDLTEFPGLKNSIVKVSQNGRWYTACITWQGYDLSENNSFSFYGFLKERKYID